MRHRAAVTNWLTAASRTQQLVARQAARLGGDLSDQVSTGEVVTVTANDVERIGSAFDVTARFAGAIVSFLVVAALLITASPMLGVIVLVGVPLLNRHRRGVELTQSGRDLLRHAEALRDAGGALDRRIVRVRHGVTDVVTDGA